MDKTQMNLAPASMEPNSMTDEMISVPLQTLFDECISYISVSDFIMQ